MPECCETLKIMLDSMTKHNLKLAEENRRLDAHIDSDQQDLENLEDSNTDLKAEIERQKAYIADQSCKLETVSRNAMQTEERLRQQGDVIARKLQASELQVRALKDAAEEARDYISHNERCRAVTKGTCDCGAQEHLDRLDAALEGTERKCDYTGCVKPMPCPDHWTKEQAEALIREVGFIEKRVEASCVKPFSNECRAGKHRSCEQSMEYCGCICHERTT